MPTILAAVLGLLVGAALGALVASVVLQRRHLQALADRDRATQAAQATQSGADSRVLQALAPVSQSLADMRRTIGDLERQRAQQYGEITEQLRHAAHSEERLRGTTETLAAALKSNSTRGVWGETQLRTVVEAAGLIERVDFDVQRAMQASSGARRPDMVVHLPGGKSLAVDAKAPFAAFLEASSIPAGASGPEAARREELLGRHVKALREHINALADKAYWSGLDVSPEFVIAFIPSESLVSAAMETDPSVMEYAFSKHVALASPVTLWSVLKTVAHTWQQDALTQDARQLFDLGRELYTRLGTMSGHIDKLGRSLTSSVKTYNAFVGSLERSVLPSARKLNALDESAIQQLTGIEETPRPTTAPELAE